MKNDSEFILPTRQDRVFHYQYGHRLLGHAKLCPWCKDYTMEYNSMEIAYRIPITLHNAQKYKGKVLYHRLNWDWVCGMDCKEAMEKRWRKALIPQSTLAEKIMKTPELPRVDYSPLDNYREMVLKVCRLEPENNIGAVVVETSTIDTIMHLTK